MDGIIALMVGFGVALSVCCCVLSIINLVVFVLLAKKLWFFEPLSGAWKFILIFLYVSYVTSIIGSIVSWSDKSLYNILSSGVQFAFLVFLHVRYNKRMQTQAPNGMQMGYPPPAPPMTPAAPMEPAQQYQSPDVEALIAACNRVGIPTSNRSTAEIANDVIKNASQETLSRLDPNMTPEQKALAILSGTI